MTWYELVLEREKLMDCASGIHAAINEGYDGSRLDTKGFDALANIHGYDRINQVLAATIREHGDDIRIRKEIREWAQKVPMLENYEQKNCFYTLNSFHPGLIDIAAKQFIKDQNGLPVVENLNGYQYQVLMRLDDSALLRRMSDYPEYVAAYGLKECKDGKIEWDIGQHYNNWDGAVSYYVDGEIDKPTERKEKPPVIIDEQEDEQHDHDFDDEDEDEWEP